MLLVDGPGSPNIRPHAFREAFEAASNEINNPFAQVDFWDDGSNVNAGLFALGITSTNMNHFLHAATSTAPAAAGLVRNVENTPTATVAGTAARRVGWGALKLVLDIDGDVDFFVNGTLLGTSTTRYETLANAYDSAFSPLVGPAGSVAGARGTSVVDNVQFGANAVPEPGSLALAGFAFAALAAARRRKA